MTSPDDHLYEPPDWLDREDEVLAPYAMRTRPAGAAVTLTSRIRFVRSISAIGTASSTAPPFAG